MQPVMEHHHDSQNVLRLPGNCSIMLYVFTCSTVQLNSSRLQTPGLACASTDGTFSVDCRATASNTTAAAMAETARRETSPHSSSGDVMRCHCHCLVGIAAIACWTKQQCWECQLAHKQVQTLVIQVFTGFSVKRLVSVKRLLSWNMTIQNKALHFKAPLEVWMDIPLAYWCLNHSIVLYRVPKESRQNMPEAPSIVQWYRQQYPRNEREA